MKTPLYDAHVALGARMVDFAGWDMPVQYAGIIAEHKHTRQHVSLFDTCHMSEFVVSGAGAAAALQGALACRIDGMHVGRCRYGFLLNEDGGVADDLICYCMGRDEFMIVGNASTREADARTLRARLPESVAVKDTSGHTAKLDLQGPGALVALNEVSADAALGLRYYAWRRMQVAGVDALVSRTGYTGELGYEFYVQASRAAELWHALLELDGVQPAGLGARDTLRLEMGYPLYGHELSEDVSPLEAGCSWALPPTPCYVGADTPARRHAREASGWRLVGLRLDGRRAARHGHTILADGVQVGRVTSGCYAPSLGCAVALAYVESRCAGHGTELQAVVRGSRIECRVVSTPFYEHGTARS